MERVLYGLRWSRCLVYLDDVISFVASVAEALIHLVLCRLSDFGLQLKAKKCTFMQTEVAFLRYIVGRTDLACDPEKISAGAPVCGVYQLLSSFHPGLCGMPTECPNFGFPNGGWPAHLGYGHQPPSSGRGS